MSLIFLVMIFFSFIFGTSSPTNVTISTFENNADCLQNVSLLFMNETIKKTTNPNGFFLEISQNLILFNKQLEFKSCNITIKFKMLN